MAGQLTLVDLQNAEDDLKTCISAEDVRVVFKRYSAKLGYKRLCRMFLFGATADELFIAESERYARFTSE